MGIFIGTKEEMLSGWEGVREVPQLRVIFSDLMSEKWCQYTPSQLAAGTRGVSVRLTAAERCSAIHGSDTIKDSSWAWTTVPKQSCHAAQV